MKEDDLNFLLTQKIIKKEAGLTWVERISRNSGRIFLILILIILYTVFHYFFLQNLGNLENINFLQNQNLTFEIQDGESISVVAKKLKAVNLIKSEIAFKTAMKLESGGELAIAGIYKFTEKDNLLSLVRKIRKGYYAIPPIKITIPEGSDNSEIAEIVSKNFTNYNLTWLNIKYIDDFSRENILEKIKFKNGILFPDTYLFLPNVSLREVIERMENNFYKKFTLELKALDVLNNSQSDTKIQIKTVDLQDFDLKNYLNLDTVNENDLDLNKKITLINKIGTTTLSFRNIIILASFLEGEAQGEEDMRMVSGVLWNRLKLDMPLQIDAATSTYRNKGFTKFPINNPGLVAIEAALNPIKTSYIYYLTDNDGIMRYARIYDDHLKNINKYLKKKR